MNGFRHAPHRAGGAFQLKGLRGPMRLGRNDEVRGLFHRIPCDLFLCASRMREISEACFQAALGEQPIRRRSSGKPP